MKKPVFLTLLLLLLTVTNVHSAQNLILNINEIKSEQQEKSTLVSTLELVTHNDESVDYVIGNVLNEDGSLYDVVNIYPEELIDGKVLQEIFGTPTVSLSSNNFNAITGGQLDIKYLFKYEINPFKKHAYLSFPIDLIKTEKGWGLFVEGRSVKTLDMISYKLGIKEIRAF